VIEDGMGESVQEPREEGWYPVPGEPNYQRYWDGEEWTSHRYWGGEGPQPDESRSERGDIGGAVAEQHGFETPASTDTLTAPLAVGTLLGAVILALVVLDILPWGVLVFLLAVPLIVIALRSSRRGGR
jgi:hypothetical protein